MNKKRSGWVNADELISQLNPDQVIQAMGRPLPTRKSGENYRMECPIEGCDAQRSNYGQLSIELKPPYRIHCFSCGVRGNLFDLLWILKHGTRPTGGRLRGDEFKEVIADLENINIGNVSSKSKPEPATENAETLGRPLRNTPLAESDNEATRSLVDLWQRGVTDPSMMTPAASRYFRDRPWLTPELCENWGVSYLPKDAKGTLRGRVVTVSIVLPASRWRTPAGILTMRQVMLNGFAKARTSKSQSKPVFLLRSTFSNNWNCMDNRNIDWMNQAIDPTFLRPDYWSSRGLTMCFASTL